MSFSTPWRALEEQGLVVIRDSYGELVAVLNDLAIAERIISLINPPTPNATSKNPTP